MPLLLKLLVEHIDPPPAPAPRSLAGGGGPGGGGLADGGSGAATVAAAAAAAAAWDALLALLRGPNAGYVYAGLLGAAATAKAFLGAHFDYRQNLVANRCGGSGAVGRWGAGLGAMAWLGLAWLGLACSGKGKKLAVPFMSRDSAPPQNNNPGCAPASWRASTTSPSSCAPPTRPAPPTLRR
jgi:hypothetical protein